jgi:hypothetical protein
LDRIRWRPPDEVINLEIITCRTFMFGHLDLTGMCDNESCLYPAFMFHSLDFTNVNHPCCLKTWIQTSEILYRRSEKSSVGYWLLLETGISKTEECMKDSCVVCTLSLEAISSDTQTYPQCVWNCQCIERLVAVVSQTIMHTPVIVKQPSMYFPCRVIAPSEKPAGDSRTRLAG